MTLLRLAPLERSDSLQTLPLAILPFGQDGLGLALSKATKDRLICMRIWLFVPDRTGTHARLATWATNPFGPTERGVPQATPEGHHALAT